MANTDFMNMDSDQLKTLTDDLKNLGSQIEDTLYNIYNELDNLVSSGLNAGSIINTTEKWMDIVNKEKDGVNYYTNNLYNKITNNIDDITEINTTYNDRLSEALNTLTNELSKYDLD